jgi:hypothetical protein
MIKRIHVNQHNIKANNKGENLPVLTVKSYNANHKVNEVHIKSGVLKYSPDKPLACGAKVWIETNEEVYIPELNKYV